jgi:hypothetical protein
MDAPLMPGSLHPRHKASAEIEGHITRAEATRARYLREVEALRMAERDLEQLRWSREVLLSGDEGR